MTADSKPTFHPFEGRGVQPKAAGGEGLQPVVLVSGPTGAGKSTFSLKLAKALDAEIVNIDSVQVYRGLDIGSAKLMPSEREGIIHHLIDILEPNESFDVAEYVRRALDAIRDIQSRKKRCVVAGGTTMYVTALFHGLADLPKADAELRKELEQRATDDLYAELKTLDQKSAERLHPNDRLRIIRALETCKLAGETTSRLREAHGFKSDALCGVMLVLQREREALYESINTRAREMVSRGLLDEVSRLKEKFGENIRPLSTIGYREALDCLRGELAKDQLAEEIALNTRHLAKRQMTYWRNEPAKREWATQSYSRNFDEICANLLKLLDNPSLRREVWRLEAVRAVA